MKPVFRYSIVINLSRNTRKISPNINTCKKIYYSLNVTVENIRHILYNIKNSLELSFNAELSALKKF